MSVLWVLGSLTDHSIRLRGPRGVGARLRLAERAHLLRGGRPGPGWGSAPVRGVWNSGLIGVAEVVNDGTALITICFGTDCDIWCSDHFMAGGDQLTWD